jgi:hypothetical protein
MLTTVTAVLIAVTAEINELRPLLIAAPPLLIAPFDRHPCRASDVSDSQFSVQTNPSP